MIVTQSGYIVLRRYFCRARGTLEVKWGLNGDLQINISLMNFLQELLGIVSNWKLRVGDTNL